MQAYGYGPDHYSGKPYHGYYPFQHDGYPEQVDDYGYEVDEVNDEAMLQEEAIDLAFGQFYDEFMRRGQSTSATPISSASSSGSSSMSPPRGFAHSRRRQGHQITGYPKDHDPRRDLSSLPAKLGINLARHRSAQNPQARHQLAQAIEIVSEDEEEGRTDQHDQAIADAYNEGGGGDENAIHTLSVSDGGDVSVDGDAASHDSTSQNATADSEQPKRKRGRPKGSKTGSGRRRFPAHDRVQVSQNSEQILGSRLRAREGMLVSRSSGSRSVSPVKVTRLSTAAAATNGSVDSSSPYRLKRQYIRRKPAGTIPQPTKEDSLPDKAKAVEQEAVMEIDIDAKPPMFPQIHSLVSRRRARPTDQWLMTLCFLNPLDLPLTLCPPEARQNHSLLVRHQWKRREQNAGRSIGGQEGDAASKASHRNEDEDGDEREEQIASPAVKRSLDIRQLWIRVVQRETTGGKQHAPSSRHVDHAHQNRTSAPIVLRRNLRR
ncbi:unnamed protein product [Jaminaea pallidilutea]